jgi:hypothetical protein
MRARPSRWRFVPSAGLLAAVLLGPSSARADSCSTPLVSTCINSDNLWPHAGASRFLTLGGTETAPRGDVAFGVYTTYLSRPVVLASVSGGSASTDYAVDNQIDASFLFAYGVTDRLQLEAVVPVTLSQTGSGASSVTGATSGLPTTGVRDVRFGLAYALVPRRRIDPQASVEDPTLPRPSVFGLTARFDVSAPTGDTAGFGSDGYSVWSPSVAGDYRRGAWFAGAELGLRLRKTEELEGARVGSQAFVGAGIGREILPRDLLSVAAEAYLLPTFSEQHTVLAPPQSVGTVSSPNGSYIVPAEWMLSVRSAPLLDGDVQVQLGGGGSIPFSSTEPITNPRFRFALAIRYAPLGRDSDGDGVLDRDDKCPFVHGVAGNPAGEGCPASAEHEQVDLTGAPPAAPATPAAPDSTAAPSTPP